VAAPSKPARGSLPVARSTPEDLVGTNVEHAKSHDLVFAVTGHKDSIVDATANAWRA